MAMNCYYFTAFLNENYFYAALHEGGIAGVLQYNYDQDDNNYNYNSNMDEYPDKTSGISLQPAAARGEITGVPPP